MKYATNYHQNLINYWQQYYPNWTIPKGYHVHHIKPKCTFDDEDDPRIHHPRNLIALHPDDHVTIHRLRGDKWANESFLAVLGNKSTGMKGKRHSAETKKKIGKKLKGRKITNSHSGELNPFMVRHIHSHRN